MFLKKTCIISDVLPLSFRNIEKTSLLTIACPIKQSELGERVT
jgi:hypothetical protein